jgi:NH3-dependent NAD+ synthetase
MTKPPSAELRPNQTDQDTLPPYEILDAILERLIEGHQSSAEIAQAGFDPQLVAKVARMVQLAEHKRRQMPPGLIVSSKAFGPGRRVPIASRYTY